MFFSSWIPSVTPFQFHSTVVEKALVLMLIFTFLNLSLVCEFPYGVSIFHENWIECDVYFLRTKWSVLQFHCSQLRLQWPSNLQLILFVFIYCSIFFFTLGNCSYTTVNLFLGWLFKSALAHVYEYFVLVTRILTVEICNGWFSQFYLFNDIL